MKKTPSNEADNFEQYQYLVKRAVGRLLSHYYLNGAIVDKEDLYQTGNIALLNAIRKFDPKRKVQFSTYATAAIRNAVIDELFKFKGPFVLAKGTARVFRFIAYLVGVGVPDDEICGQLEISDQKLKTLKKLVNIADAIVTPDIKQTNDIGDDIDIKDIMRSIFEDIDLSKEEKKIITGKMEDKSFESIGEDLGFSREKARMMYYNILEKIRDEVDG